MNVKEQIAAIANAEYPREACGVLLKGGVVVQCANTAEDPVNHFRIDQTEMAQWWETEQLVAVWHSHPHAPAVPSEADEESFVNAGVRMGCLIYSVVDEDLGWYDFQDGRLRLVDMELAE